jgi:acyl carrier protein
MLTQQAIEQWLIDYLAGILSVAREQIDPQRTFADYGLESGTMMGLTADLEQWLHAELSTAVLFEYPTIEALARHVQTSYDSLAKL